MSKFSKTFSTNKGVFKLYFTKIECGDMQKFFIAVETNSMQVASFDMKRNKEGDWEVIEPAPVCIVNAEAALSEIINEHNDMLLGVSA